MTSGEKYVAAAYLVVFLAVLVYVVIIATKLTRLERDVAELVERARRRNVERPQNAEAEAELTVG